MSSKTEKYGIQELIGASRPAQNKEDARSSEKELDREHSFHLAQTGHCGRCVTERKGSRFRVLAVCAFPRPLFEGRTERDGCNVMSDIFSCVSSENLLSSREFPLFTSYRILFRTLMHFPHYPEAPLIRRDTSRSATLQRIFNSMQVRDCVILLATCSL